MSKMVGLTSVCEIFFVRGLEMSVRHPSAFNGPEDSRIQEPTWHHDF